MSTKPAAGQLRRIEIRSIVAALRAELNGIDASLLRNAAELDNPKNDFFGPDLAHQVRVMPELTPRLGLLSDHHLIQEIIDAYVVIDQYFEQLLMLGGKIAEGMPSHRRIVEMPKDRAPRVAGLNRGVSKRIVVVVKKLDDYLKQ